MYNFKFDRVVQKISASSLLISELSCFQSNELILWSVDLLQTPILFIFYSNSVVSIGTMQFSGKFAFNTKMVRMFGFAFTILKMFAATLVVFGLLITGILC